MKPYAAMMAKTLAMLLLLPWCGAASAQGTRSHEDVRQNRQYLHEQWVRLGSAFDAEEAAALLEPGRGSLKGVLGFTEKGLRRRTTVADREWVQLFPMTRYMQEMVRVFDMENGGDPSVHRVPMKYSARVLTDRNGNFEFHGLKPGRYLLIGRVPYSFTVSHKVDSGQRQFSYSPMFGTGTISPVYTTVESRHADVLWITRVVEVKEGAPTRFEPVGR